MLVRPWQPADLPACVDARAAVHRQDGYPTRWPENPSGWVTPPSLLAAWVAVHDGAPLGHLALVAGVKDDQLGPAVGRPSSAMATVSRLFVHPAHRRLGAGEALLRAAMARAAGSDLALVLDVVDESRSAAIGLYERLGGQMMGFQAATWLTPSGDRPRLRLYVLQGSSR